MQRLLASLLLVSAAACGGDDPELVGEPLLASTLAGQFANRAFTPSYGFARTEGTRFVLHVASAEIACADDFEVPRDGARVEIGFDNPPAMGSFSDAGYALFEVAAGKQSTQATVGAAQLTTVNDGQVSATFSLSTDVAGTRYELLGAVTMIRCP
jgi:hypothetical protein